MPSARGVRPKARAPGISDNPRLMRAAISESRSSRSSQCRSNTIRRELFTAALPKTRSGKIMRRLLRDIGENRALGDTGEWLVMMGVCTHLGCVPQVLPQVGPQPFDDNWKGGFFCPCHGSKFDLAGRVYSGVPAPSNLRVPPHRFVRDDLILIGQDTGAA